MYELYGLSDPPGEEEMTASLVNVFVSSTWLDLQSERGAVESALQRLRETKFVGMKYFGSRDEDTRRTSLDEVDRCQVYVGIFGGRYGSGITEAEYRRAQELGLYCLIYFKDKGQIASEWQEQDPVKATQLAELKAELRQRHTIATFTSPDDLAAKVTADLHRWLFDEYLAPRLERAALGEFPREEAQALLAAIRDLSALNQDLLAQLWERGYAIASGEVSIAIGDSVIDSTVVAAGRDVYINVEGEPSLPDPERVLAHRAALANKAEYRRWADEFYIREEGKILPLLASPYDDDTGQQREDLLQTIRVHDRLLVLGEPGMGKTVAMQRMVWETAQADDPAVPIFVPLIFFRDDLIEAVRVALNETDELRFEDLKTVRAFLRQTRCLIMFDGLNEVPGKQRDQAVGDIAHFLREFPRHRYVVTSRSQDELWKKLRTGGAIEDAVVIQRITDEQARGYLIAHLDDQKGRELHDRLNECLRGLSRTPLLLWLIKEAGLAGEELPGNRGELFDRFVNRMLARDVKLEPVVPPAIKKQALAHLAFSLQQAHQLASERERAEKIVAKVESKHDGETILNEVLVHGLLQGEQQVRFLHQSVQEYFVGLALCKAARAERQAPTWQRVSRRLLRRNLAAWARDDWWAESFVQTAGLTEDSSWLVRELAPVKPWLAFWCSIEGKPVDNETRVIAEAKTVALLRSKDAKQRLQAVKELGRFENPRTIEYLIQALEDEDDSTVNAAAQVLAGLGEPAVEPLLAALQSGECNREAATRALGQIWELTDLVNLVYSPWYALINKSWERRSQAAKALGELGDARTVVPLIAALKDDSPVVKRAATQALGQIWQLPDLIRLVCSDEVIQVQAAKALGELGDVRAVEPLIAALRGPDKLRQAAAEALGKLGDARAVEPLIASLKEDPSENVRQAAAEALGKLGDVWALESLIASLKEDCTENVRQAAAEALGKLGDVRAVEPLIAALKDSKENVRPSAARALGELGDARAVEPLIAALMNIMNSNVQEAAAEALGKIGSPAVEPLIAFLKRASGDAYKGAGEGLERSGGLWDAVRLLANAIIDILCVVRERDWYEDPRRWAAKALGIISDSRAVEPLIDLLQGGNESVRREAVKALGQIGDPHAVESLVGVLRDAKVREEAVQALGKIRDPRAVEPLIGLLRDAREPVRAEAAEALGKIGAPAVERLITMLRDTDVEVRWRVSVTLGEIGDPRALPELERVTREDTGEFRLYKGWTVDEDDESVDIYEHVSVAKAACQAAEKIRNKHHPE